MTPFERELQRQPFRPLPAEWRDAVLAGPKKSENFRSSSRWRDWLWPSPLAWAAVAAVWLIVFSVDAVDRAWSRRPSPQVVSMERERELQQMTSSDRPLLFTWRERDRLLANLN